MPTSVSTPTTSRTPPTPRSPQDCPSPVGAILPLLAISLAPAGIRIPVTFVAVLLALALTGDGSAALGGARHLRAVLRIVLGGALAKVVTFGVGRLLGVSGI